RTPGTSLRPRAPPASDAARSPAPPEPRAARQRAQPRAGSRCCDLPQVARQVFLDDELADDLAAPRDEEDPRDRQPAPLREHLPVAVVHARIGDPVLALPVPRVGGVVLRVDADEGDAIAVLLERRLQALRLVDARDAPRRPEVEHERL